MTSSSQDITIGKESSIRRGAVTTIVVAVEIKFENKKRDCIDDLQEHISELG